jgi:polysaccharide biosynthesis protein PslH
MRGTSKVLYIAHSSPVPAKIGPSRRHFHILQQLSRFYDVHLLSLGSRSDAEMFRAAFDQRISFYEYAIVQQKRTARVGRKLWRTLTLRCDFLPVVDAPLRRSCARITTKESYDAIVLSTVLLRGLPLPNSCPLIADTHNVDCDVLARTALSAGGFFRRCYASWQARSTFKAERWAGLNVDLLLASSERDRRIFESMGVQSTAVIPNGVDVDEFSPPENSGESGLILFTGLMSYYPNQQAIRWFLNAIFPLVQKCFPEAKLVVAGAAPPPWLLAMRSHCVEVTGAVRDMRPYLERASVVIAPLLIGGGTRVKILEAQAMGRPVVSTSLGAEGLAVEHGKSILLADDAESFSTHVVRILTDPDFASWLAANGRANTVQHYDWNRIGERLQCIFQDKVGITPRQTDANGDGHPSMPTALISEA